MLFFAVTRLRQKQRQLSKVNVELATLAARDSLTGLANRRAFEIELARHFQPTGLLALLLVDPDNFKGVNDNLGHHAGDAVLQVAAERMMSCIRGGDTVARLGGDEFAILLPNITDVTDAETRGVPHRPGDPAAGTDR
jgi:diguanylate cyclase (GGDEF)-like protein